MSGISTMQLAVRIGRSRRFAENLLADLEANGLAEVDENGLWRLTEFAECEYGESLRGIDPMSEGPLSHRDRAYLPLEESA
jgi:hypothetical protein